MKTMTATFHDRERASNAVRELTEAGVPIDEISVIVVDETGPHEVSIREELRAAEGARAGGTLGAVLGAVGATLVSTGLVVVPPPLSILASGPVLALLRGVVAGGAAGFSFGALAGLEFLREDADLHEEDLRKGAAIIAVHSDELHATARRIFEEGGADRVVVS